MATKRALLVSSPSLGLKGPENDARLMKTVLEDYGFKDITHCHQGMSTRKGILDEWDKLVNRSLSEDVVVIYFSGHGGLVQPQPKDNGDGHLPSHTKPRQFIVPMDFDQTTADDFRGILDVEVSHLLQSTTKKTNNVTLVLDCCHSGSLARIPGLRNEVNKRSLPRIQHHNLLAHQELIRNQGDLPGLEHSFGNPNAVRIAAATRSESAFEYQREGTWIGSMTESLVQVLQDLKKREQEVPWDQILVRVRELLSVNFPQQHPQVQGPQTRLPFTLETVNLQSLKAELGDDGFVHILGGRLHEVYEGNEYSIQPAGTAVKDPKRKIANATVEVVAGFRALTTLQWDLDSWPKGGAVAFLEKLCLPQSPVSIPTPLPPELGALKERIDSSKYLRQKEESDRNAVVRFDYAPETGALSLSTKDGHLISIEYVLPIHSVPSKSFFDGVIEIAEQIARAQHLSNLTSLDPRQTLHHDVELEAHIISKGEKPKPLVLDGTRQIKTTDRIFIKLRNQGDNVAYAHVFDINVTGKVASMSRFLDPKGIRLKPDGFAIIGEDEYGRAMGMPLDWPDFIPQLLPIPESLVLILTEHPVDLGFLEGNVGRKRLTAGSELERLADSISTGSSRDIKVPDEGRVLNRYDMIMRSFTMTLPPKALGREICRQVDESEEILDLADLSISPRLDSETGKTVGGQLLRTIRGIPEWIVVVNEHTEPIIVAVSQYGPYRKLSEISFEAAPTGGGFGLKYEFFDSGTVNKIMQPNQKAKFSVRSRRDANAVITISVGSDETKLQIIQNDLVPLGSTIWFRNEPQLRIRKHDGTFIE